MSSSRPGSFASLLAGSGVTEELVLASETGVMALHGGIERGTGVIARRVASLVDASLYVVHQRGPELRHLTSVRYDPGQSRQLRSFLRTVRRVVSIHGFRDVRRGPVVMVGGTNPWLGRVVVDALRGETPLRVIDQWDQIPPRLRGVHPRNPVNLPEEGGVQLELSPGARTPTHVPRLVAAISTALERAEEAASARRGNLES